MATLPAFDWVESAGTSLDMEPRVRSTQFGDGYEQRAPDGLNAATERWSLVFADIDNAVATAIMGYLGAAGAVQAFVWTPLWSTTPIKVRCPRWRRVQGSRPGESTVSAEFQQVFEP